MGSYESRQDVSSLNPKMDSEKGQPGTFENWSSEAGIPENKSTIALDTEAASLYCRHLSVEKCGSGKTSLASFGPEKRYLILDAGAIRDGQLKEIHKASGGALGGTKVDDTFMAFLPEIAGPSVISQFKGKYIKEFLDIFRDFEAAGFSESPTLQDTVQSSFTNHGIIVPVEASLSVLKGAVIYGHSPAAISERLSSHIPKNEFPHFKTTHEIGVEQLSTDGEFDVEDVIFLMQGNLKPDFKFDPKSPIDMSDERNFKKDPTLIDRCPCVCLVLTLVIDTVPTLDKDKKNIKALKQYLQFHGGVTMLLLTKDKIFDEKITTAENEVPIKRIYVDTKPWSYEVKKEGEQFLRKECQETEKKIEDVLEKETPRLEHLVMCKICLDVDASVVFLPCTHMVACGLCAGYLQRCPLCRAMIDKVLYINLQ